MMKKSAYLFAMTICAVLLLAGCGKKPATKSMKTNPYIGKRAEYTAIKLFTDDKGKIVRQEKVYVKGNNGRWELGTDVYIYRDDLKLFWVYDTKKKVYTENKQSLVTDNYLLGNKPILIGEETVNGFLCNKYVTTFPSKEDGTYTTWVCKDLNDNIVKQDRKFPLRVNFYMPGNKNPLHARLHVRKPGVILRRELKNIKVGKVPDSLFEIPPGYKKIKP